MAVRRNGRGDGHGDALCFAEQREQDQQGDDGSLGQDGDDERAAANEAFAAALFQVTFDKAASQ